MPENLYKRGAIWWARVQLAGREYRRSLRTSNRPEAQKRLTHWLKELNHAAYYGDDRKTWPAAVLRYTTEVLPQSVKPSTAKRYLVSLRQLDSDLSGLYLDQIDRKKIASIISSRLKHGATNATIRRDLTAASRVLAACVAWGWRDDNPAKDFDRSIIRERRDPIRLPSDAEVLKAAKDVPAMMGKIIMWAVQTGMRENEILTLEHHQIDLDRKTVTLTKTKTDSPRVIPLTGPLTEEAVGTLAGTARHIKSKLVFWHSDGEPYRNFASNFAQQRLSHDIPFRFHDLRHKFGVEYLRRGGNIYDLQQIMGHSSIKTTEGYLAYLTPEEAAAAKKTPAQNTAQL